MYERFFGLDEQPFQLTPDPRYLFLSSKHREALGHLVYGIQEGAGFVCITGEIGAGKTTLLRALLREADESTKYAYILNPVLTGLELLQEINNELGLPATGSRRDLLAALNQALLDHKAAGRRVVLVIDEAQALDGAILEQLRLLSNFETETAKLLQIVLVGQPELRDLLSRPDLEQLNQRITVRWHLGRLDRAETAQYIAHRVRTAGQTRSLFTPGAIGAIHAYARGIPRLINVACHRSLLVAYASDRPKVNRAVVRRAIGELRNHLPLRGRRVALPRTWAAAAAAAVLLIAVAAVGVLAWRGGSGPPPLASGGPSEERIAALSEATPAAPEASPEARSSAATAAAASATADHGGATAAASAPGAAPAVEPVAAAAPPSEVGATGSTGPGAPADAELEEPGADQAEVERVMLAEAVRQTTPGNSAYEATEALLRVWSVSGLSPQESAQPTLDLQSIGRARGLEYLSFSGNLNLLRVLDLPAILEIAPDDGSSSRFVTVAHLDDDTTRVVIGRADVEVSPAVLADAWFGKAHLFWRDLDRVGGVLAVGTVNPKVKRLHALLRGVGAYEGPDSPVFSPQTEEAVMRFQRGKRLFADGKAGPLTMITLYQSVADERMPHLAGEQARPSHAEAASVGSGGGWN